jgi:hypothetical protein
VKGVDNDFEEMFRRLDLKYGRPETLADNILSELKGFKNIQEGDHMKFISVFVMPIHDFVMAEANFLFD